MSLHEVESRSVGRTGWQEARVGLSPTLGWQWEGCFSWCSTTCFKAFWVSNLGSTFSSSQMDWPLLPVTIQFLEYPILSQTPLECATLQDGMIWNGMSFPCIVSQPAAQQCSKYWSPCLAWKKTCRLLAVHDQQRRAHQQILKPNATRFLIDDVIEDADSSVILAGCDPRRVQNLGTICHGSQFFQGGNLD